MGWLISIVMLFIGCFHGNETLLITSGLFGISGAISEVATKIKETRN